MGRPIITLTTDFGTSFSYVAEMKGVILDALDGDVELVDVTHDIAPQCISEAELVLARLIETFPLGTTHLVVVDPGVGTERRAIAGQWRSHHFVGPDNGVFGKVLNAEDAHVVELTKSHLFRSPVSKTFHGRDIFAPVAAALASGLSLSDVGRPLDFVQASTIGDPVRIGERVQGRVLCKDRFGNLLTNIERKGLQGKIRALGYNDQVLPFMNTYGLGQTGDLVALFGSAGRLEVAVCNGSAAALLPDWAESTVWIELESDD